MSSTEPNVAADETGIVADPEPVAPAPRCCVRAIAQWMNSAPLRFALAVVFVLQSFVLVAFRPSYATNDDVFMTMAVSGKGIGVAPDAHLVFTNILIGMALKQLYTSMPGIPWYGGYLLLTHFLAQVALLWCALSIGRPVTGTVPPRWFAGRLAPAAPGELGLRLGVYVLYYVLVELPLINRLQFTSTAFLAATAGVFLLLAAWRRRARQPEAPIAGLLVAAASLLALGGLIRVESLVLALFIAVPVAVAVLSGFSRRALIPCGAAAILALALLAGATAYDHWCYEHDPQWAGFRSLNQLRGKFHDEKWTAYTPETAPLFSRVGWSENDHAMIARWFSDSTAIYTPAKMTTIVEGFPWRRERQTAERWTTTFRDIARNRAVLSVLLVLPLAVLAVQGGRRAKWSVVWTAAAAVALIALITWTKKPPPDRVYFPLMSFPLAVSLLALGWRDETASNITTRRVRNLVSALWSRRAWRQQSLPDRLVVSLMVVAVVMGVYSQARRSTHVNHDRILLKKFLDEVEPAGKTLYVSWEAALPYELASPLDNLAAWPRASFLSLAWTQQTAWHEAVKRRYAISDLARALYSRDDIRLVARPAHRELFVRFSQEHFDADVEFVPELEAGHKFTMGRFRLRTPHDPRYGKYGVRRSPPSTGKRDSEGIPTH